MDFVAFDIALFSVIFICAGFYFARRISKKLWANSTRVGSVILSFIAISLVPPFLDMSVDSVNKVAMHWMYLLLGLCVFLVIRKKWKERQISSDDS